MTRDRILSIIAGLLLLAGVGMIVLRLIGDDQLWLGRHAGGTPPTIAAGRMAPDFKLPGLDGKEMSLAQQRGKVVFLNVWATWCPPCREEMPSIQALNRQFQKASDFVVLAVSEDSRPASVAQYVKDNRFDFHVLLDPRNVVGEAYDVSGLPESFVIGRDGRIVAHHVGPYNWANQDILAALGDLLRARQG